MKGRFGKTKDGSFLLLLIHFCEIKFQIFGEGGLLCEVALVCFDMDGDGDIADTGLLLDEELVAISFDSVGQFV